MTFPHPGMRRSYDPRHWRPVVDQLQFYGQKDRHGVHRCPRPDFGKESPGKDGAGEFPEDGLQLA